MTNQSHDAAFQALTNLDPNVIAELEAAAERKRKQSRTSSQKKKHKQDKARSKATFDLPAELIAAIAAIAAAEGVSKSDLVAEFLTRAANAHQKGAIDLTGQKQPARSVRWDWKLLLTELEEK